MNLNKNKINDSNIQYICNLKEVKTNDYIIKFIDCWKDELIIFFDLNDNKIKIFSSICPHFGGEIIYDVKKKILKCKWHDWKFCSKSGKCLSFPIKGELNPYAFELKPNNLFNYTLKIENEEIYAIKKK